MVAESTDLTIVFTFPIRSTQGLELDHGPFDTVSRRAREDYFSPRWSAFDTTLETLVPGTLG